MNADARPHTGDEPTYNISANGGNDGGNCSSSEWVEPLDFDPWGTFTSHLLPDKKCLRPGCNDGLVNLLTKEVKAYPCHHKDCPRHWRNYAHLTSRKLSSRLPDKPYWVHLRLTSPTRLKNQDNAHEWAKAVLAHYPDAHLSTFAHRGHKDHYHVLVGTGEPTAKDTLRDLWRKHRPGKRAVPQWSGQWFYLTDFNHPHHFFAYVTLGRKAKPRTSPPWLGLPFKYPYRQYGDKR